MKLKITLLCATAIALSGCASNPKQLVTELDTKDKKYESQACLNIRDKAITYDERIGERALTGAVLGFFPIVGFVAAASIDAEHDKNKMRFNYEMASRCSSKPLPPYEEWAAQQRAPKTTPEQDKRKQEEIIQSQTISKQPIESATSVSKSAM